MTDGARFRSADRTKPRHHRDHIRVVRSGLRSLLDRSVQRIGSGKAGIEQLRSHRQLPLPYPVEQRLHLVAKRRHPRIPHRGAHPLDGMDGAKDGGNRLARRGRALQFEQQVVDRRQMLPALGQEQFGITGEVQGIAGALSQ